MDRASLERFLAAGLSLEQIGKRVDRHPSTVGYWLKKHGLEAVNKEKHAPKGGLSCDELEALVERGASVREIADVLSVGGSTVRYWLKRFGLRTHGLAGTPSEQARRARAAGLKIAQLECRHHGATEFALEGRGYYRCLRCRAEAVVRARRKAKAMLVTEAGGCCALCGYDRCMTALHFHHRDPAQKSFGLSEGGVARSLERAREEARKCVLLCSNCHAEVEAGAASLTYLRQSIDPR